MVSRKTIRTSIRMRKSLKAFLAVSLLVLYVLGNTPIEIFHQLVHGNETVVLHSVEQEKDPCHISLFHKSRKGSCDHETHLTKVEKCSLDNLIFHGDQVVLSNTEDQFAHLYFFTNQRVVSGLCHDIAAQLPSRAPPILFLA